MDKNKEKEEKEKILEYLSFALNNANHGSDWGIECVYLIGLYYSVNRRYSAELLTKKLLGRLDNRGKRHLHDLWALCGLSLVFCYIKGCNNTLNLYGTEVMEFAYEHRRQLSVEFCRYTRVGVDFDNYTAEDLSGLKFSDWLFQQNMDYFAYTVDLLFSAEVIDGLYLPLKRYFFLGVWSILQNELSL